MSMTRPLLVLGLLVSAALVAGCSGLIPPNADTGQLPGGRRWIIEVDNQSAKPASLLVAVDGAPGPATNIGPTVGRATPNTVAPFSNIEVTFDVPAGTGWAIFVNPDPHGGPLILAGDVPASASGKLPVTIHISPEGNGGASLPANAGPGWFGD